MRPCPCGGPISVASNCCLVCGNVPIQWVDEWVGDEVRAYPIMAGDTYRPGGPSSGTLLRIESLRKGYVDPYYWYKGK